MSNTRKKLRTIYFIASGMLLILAVNAIILQIRPSPFSYAFSLALIALYTFNEGHRYEEQ